MKKVIVTLAVATTSLLLGACGNTSANKVGGDSAKISSLKKENASLKSELNATAGNTNEEKQLNAVGRVQYTITSVKQETVKNREENYTNAEFNFQDIKDYPKTYRRATITYKLKNVGNKPFDLSSMQNTVTDNDGNEYSDGGGDIFGFDENSNGTVKPGVSTSGKFTLLSKNKINLKSFVINVTDQFTDDDINLGGAGSAKY